MNLLAIDGAPKRAFKGKSLLSFPSSYVVIDIETTGLNPECDEIIEICADRYIDGQFSDRFLSLVHPEYPIPAFIESLTGITNDMVADAEPIWRVLPVFWAYVGNLPLVGHNVNFDVNFIYDRFMDYLQIPFCNDFVDTLRLSRRLLTDLPNHQLITLARSLGFDTSSMHRAGADCTITDAIYKHCHEVAVERYGSAEGFLQAIIEEKKQRQRQRSGHRTQLSAKDITTDVDVFDVSHPLYGRVCVFTGKLDRFLRKDAMQAVVDVGGICGDRVTKETNILVMGDLSYSTSIKEGKSNKQVKAEKLILDGADLQIITESTFLDMLAYGEE